MNFEFWYKGHQVLAAHSHGNIFHFYIGLVDPTRIQTYSFEKFLENYFENDDLITTTDKFDEPFANKNLYSAQALSFFSTKDSGIEAALHLCDAVSQLDYSERDYQEFNFIV